VVEVEGFCFRSPAILPTQQMSYSGGIRTSNPSVNSCGALICEGERSFAIKLILLALMPNSLLG